MRVTRPASLAWPAAASWWTAPSRSSRAAAAELRRAGHEPEVVSAGGTGTFDLTGADPLVTEIKVSSYVIMDVFHQETSPQFGVAVTVAATVLAATET